MQDMSKLKFSPFVISFATLAISAPQSMYNVNEHKSGTLMPTSVAPPQYKGKASRRRARELRGNGRCDEKLHTLTDLIDLAFGSLLN